MCGASSIGWTISPARSRTPRTCALPVLAPARHVSAHVRGVLDRAGEIVHPRGFGVRRQKRTPRGTLQLGGVADHRIDLAHGAERIAVRVRGAARHDDARIGPLAARAAHGAPKRAHRLVGDRASVVDDQGTVIEGTVIGSHRFGVSLDGGRLGRVQAAAMGDDIDRGSRPFVSAHEASTHEASARAGSSRSHAPVRGSRRPDHSHSLGPVMMT